jgi:hypothetical protein
MRTITERRTRDEVGDGHVIGHSVMHLFHTIPVGGNEPVHDADVKCWCYPTSDRNTPEVIVHNAKDCREARERNGVVNPDLKWVLIGQRS